jgi:gliding motility-associated-like protein
MNMQKGRTTFFCFLFFLCTLLSYAQRKNIWASEKAENLLLYQKNVRKIKVQKEKIFKLELSQLKMQLKKCKKRSIGKNQKTVPVLVDFPNKEKGFASYEVFETSYMGESLQAKYPSIKSYIGIRSDQKGSVRFSVSSLGLHAMIFDVTGKTYYIDPYTKDGLNYTLYSKSELSRSKKAFHCETEESISANKEKKSARGKVATDGKLRTFRLALGCTGEYAQFHLADQGIPDSASDVEKKTAVLSAMYVTLTRINAIYERELALTLELVANNDQLVFLNPATDGLTNNNVRSMLDEIQEICDANIGFLMYDIGHVFARGNSSGVAELASPCTSRKAQGVTRTNLPKGDAFDVDFVAHEMGHQFGATHTFSNDCSGNRTNTTAVEPGSGSTIMAYTGICAPNLQEASDAYFHSVSLEQITGAIVFGNNNCGALTDIGTTGPSADAGENYTIPISTPFQLEGLGNVQTGTASYTWEQRNTEQAIMPPLSNNIGGPLFRSLPPESQPFRYFPAINTLLNGELGSTWEQLPSVERQLNFAFTVRDNNTFGGQIGIDEMSVSVSEDAGPFFVTSQAVSEVFLAGESKLIEWEVANTNIAPVSAPEVDVLLSVDGGQTYPHILASAVDNDGSQSIVVPNLETTQARVKVAGTNHIFFNINAADIEIQASSYVMSFETDKSEVCAPEIAVFDFEYKTYFGFNEETQFSVTGLPPGTSATILPENAIFDGTKGVLKIAGITDRLVGNYEILFHGVSGEQEKTVSLELEIFNEELEIPVLQKPAPDALHLINPVQFEWNAQENIAYYDFEVAEDADFSSIVYTNQLSENELVYNGLNVQSTYYWRVRAVNSCSESEFSSPGRFFTGKIEEAVYASEGINLLIPDNNPTGVSATIDIPEHINLSDVDVLIHINHTYLGDLRIVLFSPDGEEVVLVKEGDDSGRNYVNTIFDSESNLSLISGRAPYSGRFRPSEDLFQLNTTDAYGEWTLKVVDTYIEDTGTLLNWELFLQGVIEDPNDWDGDSVNNAKDNCSYVPNPEQIDVNNNGVGDVCETNAGVLIPRGFSPNNDGINDTWKLSNINDGSSGSGMYPTATVAVFDSNGKLVFRSNAYQNNWDGTDSNGRKLPIGSYLYKISAATDGFSPKIGWLYLRY